MTRLTEDEAHRRALADVNGDRVSDGPIQLLACALFVVGLIALVALATGHVHISIQ